MVRVESAICVKHASIAGGEIDSEIVHSDGKHITVRVHSNELNEIVDGKKVTPAELLYAAPFNIKYNEFHVAVEI